MVLRHGSGSIMASNLPCSAEACPRVRAAQKTPPGYWEKKHGGTHLLSSLHLPITRIRHFPRPPSQHRNGMIVSMFAWTSLSQTPSLVANDQAARDCGRDALQLFRTPHHLLLACCGRVDPRLSLTTGLLPVLCRAARPLGRAIHLLQIISSCGRCCVRLCRRRAS